MNDVPDLRIVGDLDLGTLSIRGNRITFTKPDGTVLIDETSEEGWSIHFPPLSPLDMDGGTNVLVTMVKKNNNE